MLKILAFSRYLRGVDTAENAGSVKFSRHPCTSERQRTRSAMRRTSPSKNRTSPPPSQGKRSLPLIEYFNATIKPCNIGDIFDPVERHCIPCAASTYSHDPSAEKCQNCPEGAQCIGGNHLSTTYKMYESNYRSPLTGITFVVPPDEANLKDRFEIGHPGRFSGGETMRHHHEPP